MTTDVDYALFSSCGNDSVALCRWAFEKGLKNVAVVYSDTGWAADHWNARVERAEDWVTNELGFQFVRLESVGMVALVHSKKGWPRNGMQFCTSRLKIEPAERWLDEVDPNKDVTCLVGVRREESKARQSWPEYLESSDKHGGRSLWSPLAGMDSTERDELVYRGGWTPLETRSQECFPCVNASRKDLRDLTPERIDLIERIEKDLGLSSTGKPKHMFRSNKFMGATGIREIYRWALSRRGKYEPPESCDSGYCGG